MLEKWMEQVREIPFVDAHCHVMPQGIGEYATGNAPFKGQSRLAGLLTGFGSLLNFLSAGMSQEELNGIRSGMYSKEQAKETVLQYLPKVETMLPVAFCRRGLSLLAGQPVEINRDTWDALEALMVGSDYDRIVSAMDRDNIEKGVLNLWTGWSASYYGRYWQTLSEADKAKDRRAFVNSATFDFYALVPFAPATREYARLLHADAETFAGYEDLLHRLARYFVENCDARAFKISEMYFRKLDYEKVERSAAERCFKEVRTAEEERTLANFVTWTVLEEARRWNKPVQIHTGELWGDPAIDQVNPMYLLNAVRKFPDVRFELLHGGYPFTAETGILAQNFSNMVLNLAYMPLRSLTHFEQWLEIYGNLIPADRILLGTDVFDIDCMAGCVDMIRDSCAHYANRLEEQGVASEAAITRMLHKIFHENAEQYYGFSR